ncbi:hypothetical protein Bbelb_207860 [Branchiostoma belcheri]|nr:hypothetical protein Bbelb_207860 [Branchiostoma belcheri]
MCVRTSPLRCHRKALGENSVVLGVVPRMFSEPGMNGVFRLHLRHLCSPGGQGRVTLSMSGCLHRSCVLNTCPSPLTPEVHTCWATHLSGQVGYLLTYLPRHLIACCEQESGNGSHFSMSEDQHFNCTLCGVGLNSRIARPSRPIRSPMHKHATRATLSVCAGCKPLFAHGMCAIVCPASLAPVLPPGRGTRQSTPVLRLGYRKTGEIHNNKMKVLTEQRRKCGDSQGKTVTVGGLQREDQEWTGDTAFTRSWQFTSHQSPGQVTPVLWSSSTTGYQGQSTPARGFSRKLTTAPPLQPAWSQPNAKTTVIPRRLEVFSRKGMPHSLLQGVGSSVGSRRLTGSSVNASTTKCLELKRDLKRTRWQEGTLAEMLLVRCGLHVPQQLSVVINMGCVSCAMGLASRLGNGGHRWNPTHKPTGKSSGALAHRHPTEEESHQGETNRGVETQTHLGRGALSPHVLSRLPGYMVVYTENMLKSGEGGSIAAVSQHTCTEIRSGPFPEDQVQRWEDTLKMLSGS